MMVACCAKEWTVSLVGDARVAKTHKASLAVEVVVEERMEGGHQEEVVVAIAKARMVSLVGDAKVAKAVLVKSAGPAKAKMESRVGVAKVAKIPLGRLVAVVVEAVAAVIEKVAVAAAPVKAKMGSLVADGKAAKTKK
jgi:hypothetical protein